MDVVRLFVGLVYFVPFDIWIYLAGDRFEMLRFVSVYLKCHYASKLVCNPLESNDCSY